MKYPKTYHKWLGSPSLQAGVAPSPSFQARVAPSPSSCLFSTLNLVLSTHYSTCWALQAEHLWDCSTLTCSESSKCSAGEKHWIHNVPPHSWSLQARVGDSCLSTDCPACCSPSSPPCRTEGTFLAHPRLLHTGCAVRSPSHSLPTGVLHIHQLLLHTSLITSK